MGNFLVRSIQGEDAYSTKSTKSTKKTKIIGPYSKKTCPACPIAPVRNCPTCPVCPAQTACPEQTICPTASDPEAPTTALPEPVSVIDEPVIDQSSTYDPVIKAVVDPIWSDRTDPLEPFGNWTNLADGSQIEFRISRDVWNVISGPVGNGKLDGVIDQRQLTSDAYGY